jgi:hypothetical protein
VTAERAEKAETAEKAERSRSAALFIPSGAMDLLTRGSIPAK